MKNLWRTAAGYCSIATYRQVEYKSPLFKSKNFGRYQRNLGVAYLLKDKWNCFSDDPFHIAFVFDYLK